MASDKKNEYVPDVVSPPGDSLNDLLQDFGMTQVKLAERTGRPLKTINEIIHGKTQITPETALQFEKVLSVPASFWNNREKNYREYLARANELTELEKRVGWVRNFPYQQMAKFGWIPDTRYKVQRLRNLLSYFGVASIQSWEDTWTKLAVAYRKSENSTDYSLASWLQQGEVQAKGIDSASYDEKTFYAAMRALREASVENPESYIPKMSDLCAQAGVAVVFVPELTGSRVSGATRWLSSDKALIQLSLRYKRDDQLWFTFFHECFHILKHGKRAFIIETENLKDDRETEADNFASDFLIPPGRLLNFTLKGDKSRTAVLDFAHELGIAPGIVVGRLQHDKFIPYRNLNDLKVKFEWTRN